MKEKIQSIIRSSIAVKSSMLEHEEFSRRIEAAAGVIIDAFKKGNRLYLCGNGGSAADAQHIAAEFTGRFYKDRTPLPAEALHVNTSFLTAVANDYSYDEVYERAVKAYGRAGDVLIGISTSGNSKNVLRAQEEAKKRGMTVISLTGESGGKLKDVCDFLFNVPSSDTPRIQESHILIGHILAQLTEEELFKKTSMDPVIILAGGLGTRLRSVVNDIPKVMAPIKGKPFLAYVLDSLERQGVGEAILSVGYKKEVIQNYFGTAYKSIALSYAQEDEPLGTGGGIRKAFEKVTDRAFVLNGDTYFDVDLKELQRFHDSSKSDLVLALKHLANFDRYGTVNIDTNNRAVAFAEKKQSADGLINGGVYYFSKELFDKIKIPQVHSFEKDVLEKYAHTLTFSGKVFDGYFVDIGVPEDYAKAQRDLA